jgi:hypothetical protein
VELVRFVTVRTLPLREAEVWPSWMRFYRETPEVGPTPVDRSMEPVGDHQTRFVTRGRTGAGGVRIDAVVTFEGTRDWSVRSETELNDRPFGRESAHYHVAPLEGVSTVTVSFEIVGRTGFVDLMLWLGTGRLRRQREQTLDAWVASMGPPGPLPVGPDGRGRR